MNSLDPLKVPVCLLMFKLGSFFKTFRELVASSWPCTCQCSSQEGISKTLWKSIASSWLMHFAEITSNTDNGRNSWTAHLSGRRSQFHRSFSSIRILSADVVGVSRKQVVNCAASSYVLIVAQKESWCLVLKGRTGFRRHELKFETSIWKVHIQNV